MMSKDVPMKKLFKEYGNSLVMAGAGTFLTTLSLGPIVAAKGPVLGGVIGISGVVAATGLSIVAMTAISIRDRYYYNAPTCG